MLRRFSIKAALLNWALEKEQIWLLPKDRHVVFPPAAGNKSAWRRQTANIGGDVFFFWKIWNNCQSRHKINNLSSTAAAFKCNCKVLRGVCKCRFFCKSISSQLGSFKRLRALKMLKQTKGMVLFVHLLMFILLQLKCLWCGTLVTFLSFNHWTLTGVFQCSDEAEGTCGALGHERKTSEGSMFEEPQRKKCGSVSGLL